MTDEQFRRAKELARFIDNLNRPVENNPEGGLWVGKDMPYYQEVKDIIVKYRTEILLKYQKEFSEL